MNIKNNNIISEKVIKPRLVKRSLTSRNIKITGSTSHKNETLISENIKETKIQTRNNLSSLTKVTLKNDPKIFNKELLKNIRKKNEFARLNKDTQIKIKQQTVPTLPIVRKTQTINYKNIKLLRSFLTDFKKIKSRRLTKLTLKQQRQLSRSVKRARMLKLFDPRKTLKPRKFLNFERKRETLQILLLLQVINRKNFLEIIRVIKIDKVQQVTKFFELIALSENRNYLTFNKTNIIL